jgi:hypothetical protein
VRETTLIFSGWKNGEGGEVVARGMVRLDSIVAWHSAHEDTETPSLHLHLAGGRAIVIEFEEITTVDGWQEFSDFLEELERATEL